MLTAKSGYLSQNFFVLRAYVFFGLWSLWIFSIYRQSTKQDTQKSVRQMHIALAMERAGIVPGVVVGTLASYRLADVVGAEPGIRPFSVCTFWPAARCRSCRVVTLVALGFRRAGILTNAITMEHYHDLGKWMFALTAFYTYIAFSQYILIWYANLPEETVWYRLRYSPGAGCVWGLAMPFIRFIIPFFVLLCRPAKRNLTILGPGGGV